MGSLYSKQLPKARHWIFLLLAILLCGRHLCLLVGLNSIASYLFMALFAVSVLFLFTSLLEKIEKQESLVKKIVFFIEIVSFVWLFCSLILSYTAYLKMASTFLIAFPILICFDAITATPRSAEIYFTALKFVAIGLSLSILIPSNYNEGILFLYTANGNQSGLLYMSVFLGNFIGQSLKKRNVFDWLLNVALLVGCYLTQSRTAFFVCIIVTIISMVFSKASKFNYVLIFGGVAIFFFLPFFIKPISGFLESILGFLEDSLFTGRENIWPRILSVRMNEPWGIKIDQVVADHYGTDLRAHNVWLDVAWNFSLPMAAIFLCAVIAVGYYIGKQAKTHQAVTLASCFFGFLLHMTFEASLLSGALDYTLYFLISFLSGITILNGRKQNESKCAD